MTQQDSVWGADSFCFRTSLYSSIVFLEFICKAVLVPKRNMFSHLKKRFKKEFSVCMREGYTHTERQRESRSLWEPAWDNRPYGDGAINSCRATALNAGNSSWVLCRSNMCSELLSYSYTPLNFEFYFKLVFGDGYIWLEVRWQLVEVSPLFSACRPWGPNPGYLSWWQVISTL